MSVHYIYNFVRDNGDYELDYFNSKTVDELNDYIYENIDTSYWNRCDLVRVSLDCDCDGSWCDTKGLFVWDGSKVIFPFYNGNVKRYSSPEYSVNQKICCDGFMPNTFQAIHDFYPEDISCLSDGFSNKIFFTDLSDMKYDIIDNMRIFDVSNCYTDEISLSRFYYNGRSYILLMIGEYDSGVGNYLENNRPYDFDIYSAIDEYNIDTNVQDILDTFDESSDTQILFIRPEYFNINFNISCRTNKISNIVKSTNSRRNTKNVTREEASKYCPQVEHKAQKTKCQAVKSNGQSCSRMAKSGNRYCGIHSK